MKKVSSIPPPPAKSSPDESTRQLPEVAGRVRAGEDQLLILDGEMVPAGLEQAAASLSDMHDAKLGIKEDHAVGDVLQALDHGTDARKGDVRRAARLPAALDPVGSLEQYAVRGTLVKGWRSAWPRAISWVHAISVRCAKQTEPHLAKCIP